jgi:hypothetical protein
MLGEGSEDTVHFRVLRDQMVENYSGRTLQPGSSLGQVVDAGGQEESQSRMNQKLGGTI